MTHEEKIMDGIRKGLLTNEDLALINKRYTAVVMNFLKEKGDHRTSKRLANDLRFPEEIVRYVLHKNNGELKVIVIDGEEFYSYLAPQN